MTTSSTMQTDRRGAPSAPAAFGNKYTISVATLLLGARLLRYHASGGGGRRLIAMSRNLVEGEILQLSKTCAAKGGGRWWRDAGT